jgi:hypothetical protein
VPDREEPDDAPTEGEAPGDDAAGSTDTVWTDGGSPDRERTIRIAQIAMVVVALLIVGFVVLKKGGSDDGGSGNGGDQVASDGSGSDGKPAKADWPKDAKGRPPAFGKTNDPPPATTTAKPGAYIWSDFDGWHLWVVPGEGVGAISGTLTSNDKVQKAVLAVEGAGSVDVEDKTARFSLPADRPVSGIDFNPGFYGKQIVITLNGPDGPLDGRFIFLGKKATVAPFPLVLQKTVPR